MPMTDPKLPKIDIRTDGVVTNVLIDGQPIPGLLECTAHFKGGELPYVMLKVYGEQTIDGRMIVPLPEPWRSFIEDCEPGVLPVGMPIEDRSDVAEALNAEEIKRIYGAFNRSIQHH